MRVREGAGIGLDGGEGNPDWFDRSGNQSIGGWV